MLHFLGLFIVILMPIQTSEAATFVEYIQKIESHPEPNVLLLEGEALREKGASAGSWGDPLLKVAAQNFPEKSLKSSETPMTGIQYSLSQKLALTTEYGNLRRSFEALGEAKRLGAAQIKREMIRTLWQLAIMLEKNEKDLKTLAENLNWLSNMLAVSKKRYTNGRLSQQGYMDIKIRKSKLESQVSNLGFFAKELQAELTYLLGDQTAVLDLSSVPWGLLKGALDTEHDYKERALAKKLKASDLKLTATKQGFVPNITLGMSYTHRAGIDGAGDFVGAFISMPLPTSSKKYGAYGNAVQKRYGAEKGLRAYQMRKRSNLMKVANTKDKLQADLKILSTKTIPFAKTSRAISSKSYRLGRATYFELLKSELQLQEFLIHLNGLEAQLKSAQLQERFWKGAYLGGTKK
ncbi:MAG: TolC family protein [Halobacteriovoraceae bacterium]|mgnify:CR=1 FL=1|nr:TolC family protein [Halobacteriovoraceae bacterium]